MEFFKKLFGNEDPDREKQVEEQHTQEQMNREEEPDEASESEELPEIAQLLKELEAGKSVDELDLDALPPAFRQLVRDELSKKAETLRNQKAYQGAVEDFEKAKDIPVEEIYAQQPEKLLPRLRMGHLEDATGMKATTSTPEGEQEVDIPREHLLHGFDMGPDFSCCLAFDLEESFQLLTNHHVEKLGKAREELLKQAMDNFLQRHSNIQVHDTQFEGVKMFRTDGETEATLLIFSNVWQNVLQQMDFQRLHILAPTQGILVCWDTITDETRQELIQSLVETREKTPSSQYVTNFLYRYEGDKFEAIEKIF